MESNTWNKPFFPHYIKIEAEQPLSTWKKVRCEESFARTQHASVLIDNQIIVIGGIITYDWTDEVGCYNLLDQTFQTIEPDRHPLNPITKHTACYYQDRIIVFGGENEDGEVMGEIMSLTIQNGKRKS